MFTMLANTKAICGTDQLPKCIIDVSSCLLHDTDVRDNESSTRNRLYYILLEWAASHTDKEYRVCIVLGKAFSNSPRHPNIEVALISTKQTISLWSGFCLWCSSSKRKQDEWNHALIGGLIGKCIGNNIQLNVVLLMLVFISSWPEHANCRKH